MRVELPNYQWAEMIDVADITSGDMKAYRRSMPVGTGLTVGILDDMRDVLLARLITNWSFQVPIPRELPGTPEEAGALDRIPPAAYDALVEALGPYMDVFNGVEPDPKPSPESAGTSPDSESTSAMT